MFRFTIRDVLWLTVVAALAAGWYAHWASSRAQHEALLKEHLELLTKQSDATMTGVNEMVTHMHERADLQRQYMDEKKKNMQYRVELSQRLQQELNNARRIDTEQAKAQASEKAGAAAASDNRD
jgi:hypothetical protein